MPAGSQAHDDFPITWNDPSEEGLTWDWDDMHMPHALTPLSADYVTTLGAGFRYRYQRLGVPIDVLCRVWNGYAFFALKTDWPAEEQEAALAALPDVRRAHIPRALRFWTEQALPEQRALRAWFRALRVDDLSPDALADAWDEAWQRADRAWKVHFYAITGPYQALDDLAEFYEGVVAEAPPGEALALCRGGIDELQAVDTGIDELITLAEGVPGLPDILTSARVTDLGEVRSMPGSGPFIDALSAFLDEHGHLGGSFDDLASPTWMDAPHMLLADIGRRMRNPGLSADERRDRLRAEGDRLVASVRTTLADRPDESERFERLLEAAIEIGPLTEIHNYWIDRLVQSCLRGLALDVGRRLVTADVLDASDDVLYLTRAEIGESLRTPRDLRAIVVDRRSIHARQAARKPPRQVGKVPDEAGDGDRFDGNRYEHGDDGTLRGTGASAGRARGVARVILGPGDFDRVGAGDIVVAPSSNPSWLPLFTVAGGLITDTGGVLSHAAVVAREFGLPAVVGLGDATTRIAEGSTVEIDGATGIVRVT